MTTEYVLPAFVPDDLNRFVKDNAVFFPAYQRVFTQYANDSSVTEWLAHAEMDFEHFNPLGEKGLFRYDYGLISAGNGSLDIAQSKIEASIIWNRRQGTTIMSDSGGYQTLSGGLDVQEYQRMSPDIVNWQGAISDIIIGMDVPPKAAKNSAKTGIISVEECLQRTASNIEWAVLNRDPNKGSRYLNVTQVPDEPNPLEKAVVWYNAVKTYNDIGRWGAGACSGWAVGGLRDKKKNIPLNVLLRLILRMLEDDNLSGRNNWIHVLGIGAPERFAIMTAIQLALRILLDDPNFRISTDSSSPFFAVGKTGTYFVRLDYLDEKRGKVQYVEEKMPLPNSSFLEHIDVHRFGLESTYNSRVGRTMCGFDIRQLTATAEVFGVDTVGKFLANTPLLALGPMISHKNKAGRVSPLGYSLMYYISLYTYIRHVYEKSELILAEKEGLVDQIVNAFRSSKPDAALSRIFLG